ncbi:hypothetical protein [Acetobacter senegalensis]|uniref:hypothetical protein n=1 Tax=Acetobacter senegalensis TaxID=446692 RepID=UPI0026564B40|nr:hypothetical protein [Acetobacter senegalensis]MDN7351034.1 hypothetical protein [Acetobacter senegalensis]
MKFLIVASITISVLVSPFVASAAPNHTLPQFEKLGPPKEPQQPAKTQPPEKGK